MCRRQYANDVCNRGTAGTFLGFKRKQNTKLTSEVVFKYSFTVHCSVKVFPLNFLALQIRERAHDTYYTKWYSRGIHRHGFFLVRLRSCGSELYSFAKIFRRFVRIVATLVVEGIGYLKYDLDVRFFVSRNSLASR